VIGRLNLKGQGMIKSLKAVGLNRRMTFTLNFHDDINIITGKNGSGKTTVLKLLWYAISGNLERIVPEIPFRSFEVVTDKMMVGMTIDPHKSKRQMLQLRYRLGEADQKEVEKPLERSMDWEELMEVNRSISRLGTSVFLPTFRRIEGGFSISNPDSETVRFFGGRIVHRTQDLFEPGGLQQSMNRLSDRLSVGNHRFVASISTDDIIKLVTSKYAEISERTNRLHMELSRFILEQVSATRMAVSGTPRTVTGGGEETESQEALEEIRRRASNVTSHSEALLRPFTVLSQLIVRLFQYRGIRLAEPVTLGDAAGAISSEVLSAGEKQMLSFLCYNAFASKSSLFIDEPEISLHVDWQRILFPILLDQSAGNQFIVATHSPFIYSKYADKELMLSEDRGDDNAHSSDDRG
jgi:predicted ATPase